MGLLSATQAKGWSLNILPTEMEANPEGCQTVASDRPPLFRTPPGRPRRSAEHPRGGPDLAPMSYTPVRSPKLRSQSGTPAGMQDIS